MPNKVLKIPFLDYTETQILRKWNKPFSFPSYDYALEYFSKKTGSISLVCEGSFRR
jgi:hypothetical protein